ncbi:MAG: AsmA-like C-terminal region-containing protein [Nannocystaceae bacterium]|nr:AsmA-like C-terminal region-containing protein [Nannocystaceae bacterium]
MRRLVLVLLSLVLVVAGVAGALWWTWRSIDVRAELEARLTEAVGRPVHLGAVEVDARGRVALHDVTVDDDPAFSERPLLHAEAIALDIALESLLDRELVGVSTARGVTLHVVKRGGTTNLAGLFPTRGGGGTGMDVQLDLAITDAKVELEDADRGETLQLDDVDVRVLLSNRGGDKQAAATVAIATVGLHGVALHELTATVRGSNEGFTIDELQARLGQRGRVSGHGELLLSGPRGWSFTLAVAQADLDADLRPIVAAVFPPLAQPLQSTAAAGTLGATVTLGGAGLHWAQVRPSLQGHGTVQLRDLVLPPGSLLVDLAALAGHDGKALTLHEAEVTFDLADDWVSLTRVTADGAITTVPLTGRVSLGGALDLRFDLMPILSRFGGGAYQAIARHATSLPVRIRGTVSKPELAPPTAADAGRSLLGGALRRVLRGDGNGATP